MSVVRNTVPVCLNDGYEIRNEFYASQHKSHHDVEYVEKCSANDFHQFKDHKCIFCGLVIRAPKY